MSKPITRVVISVLIALVLVMGVFTSVQGAILNAGTKSAHAYAVGVSLGLRHNRTLAPESASSAAQSADTYDQSDGGCNHDSIINPEDY